MSRTFAALFRPDRLAASALLLPPRERCRRRPRFSTLSFSSSSPTHARFDGYNDQHDDDAVVRQRTLRWLEEVVIGMSLCPFADRPHREGRVAVDVCRDGDDGSVAGAVLAECARRREAPGTTLVVCPVCHPRDFRSYLGVVRMVEDGLQEGGLAEGIQVAPFHPEFVFEGSSESSPDNWTNRSPYPTFHVLREDEVTVAVDKIDGDAGRVWKRNVNLLHDLSYVLGRRDFERYMLPPAAATSSSPAEDSARSQPGDHHSNSRSSSGSTLPSDAASEDQDLEDRVKEILRRFRSQL
jgi:hypothetical protein